MSVSAREFWLTNKEVSKLLGVHRQTVWRLVKDGKLPSPKPNPVSKRNLYAAREIREYLKEHNG